VGKNRLVYIVDDDRAVRRSTAFMLQHAGFRVETFESGSAFLNIARTAERGCILLDILMPSLDGLEVQQKLIDNGIDMPVIVLTGHGDIEAAVQAMRLGAINFYEKPCQKERLLEGLDEAFRFLQIKDFRQMSASLAQIRLACLTARERDVLDGLTKGKSNKAISQELGLSSRTVEVHRANMMTKLRVRNLAQALRIGFSALPSAANQIRPMLPDLSPAHH